LLCATAVLGACRAKEDEAIAGPFSDTFDRAELGPAWRDTGGDYHVVEGKLAARNAYNHPAWLRKRLPRDVLVEIDAQSKSAAGDIKLELFGDGTSFDPDRGGYVSTGYVFIFGGWSNSLSVICRNNEHGEGRKAARGDRPVEINRIYHFAISRKNGHIDWLIDGAPFLAWTDPQPLVGSGHDHLGVNDWEAEVLFDNVSIRPAP
jgi:Farnesoic acid 0-methyl transferase